MRAELLSAKAEISDNKKKANDKYSHLESTFKLIKLGFDGNAEHCLALVDIFIQSYHQG